MLKDYFLNEKLTSEEYVERHKRLIAVQAAYELAKASASAAGGNVGSDKMKFDLKHASAHISEFADAIQAALEK
ncbi:hypothetical protein TH59_02840 [Pantoea ananatis]|uniref:hypothetical protein n=1 Tax=Pantoea ananas TaxID=553 RepID=UPI0023501651|nr:hypothetical protein [Pantoea ananatis]MDC7863893.1 hypothetical protein [Pantoea ananatis]